MVSPLKGGNNTPRHNNKDLGATHASSTSNLLGANGLIGGGSGTSVAGSAAARMVKSAHELGSAAATKLHSDGQFITAEIARTKSLFGMRAQAQKRAREEALVYHTIRYNTTLYHTIRYNTTLYHTIRYNTTRYHTIPHDTTRYHTIPHDTTRYHTIPHDTTRYLTLYHTLSYIH